MAVFNYPFDFAFFAHVTPGRCPTEKVPKIFIPLPVAEVVVDLGGVEYISSAGLRVILTMVKASKAAAATLAFCSMQSMVAEVFKISGFSSMLPIYATRDEAVSALS